MAVLRSAFTHPLTMGVLLCVLVGAVPDTGLQLAISGALAVLAVVPVGRLVPVRARRHALLSAGKVPPASVQDMADTTAHLLRVGPCPVRLVDSHPHVASLVYRSEHEQVLYLDAFVAWHGPEVAQAVVAHELAHKLRVRASRGPILAVAACTSLTALPLGGWWATGLSVVAIAAVVLFLLARSRADEYAADAAAVAAVPGVGPALAATLVEHLPDDNWIDVLSTHPPTRRRAERLLAASR